MGSSSRDFLAATFPLCIPRGYSDRKITGTPFICSCVPVGSLKVHYGVSSGNTMKEPKATQ